MVRRDETGAIYGIAPAAKSPRVHDVARRTSSSAPLRSQIENSGFDEGSSSKSTQQSGQRTDDNYPRMPIRHSEGGGDVSMDFGDYDDNDDDDYLTNPLQSAPSFLRHTEERQEVLCK